MPNQMTLLKPPFLISVIWSTYITFTSPHPIEPRRAIVQTRFPMFMAPILKMLFLSPVLLEIILIILPNAFSQALHLLTPLGITTPFLIGWTINLSGGLLRRACYISLGIFFTFEMGTRKDHKLITSGPYSIVRHPAYTGAVLTSVGCILVFNSCAVVSHFIRPSAMWVFIGILSVIILPSRLSNEDQMLRKHFGQEWERWRERVPYRLIPGIY
ncbi:hypothetical protein BDQ17DRAFT_1544619 [Cyathus striatus]|nr:hypothetical protein BDQ17DRAFT_1544619 [Cyathus striatus]